MRRNTGAKDCVPTVIVLGAGASVPDGAPVQKDLFTAYFGMEPHPSTSPTVVEMNAQISAFFQTFFGIDPAVGPISKEYPTFEEALGMIELALHNEASFRG